MFTEIKVGDAVLLPLCIRRACSLKIKTFMVKRLVTEVKQTVFRVDKASFNKQSGEMRNSWGDYALVYTKAGDQTDLALEFQRLKARRIAVASEVQQFVAKLETCTDDQLEDVIAEWEQRNA